MTYTIEMSRDEAILLQRAAMAGLKGSRPVHQNRETAQAVLAKLYGLADQLMASCGPEAGE